MTRETRVGWIASAALHALLLLLLLVLAVPRVTQEPEFLQVQWGSIAAAAPARSAEEGRREALVAPTPASPSRVKGAPQPSQPVVLPRRTQTDLSPDAIPVPRAEKLNPAEGTVAPPEPKPSLKTGERESIPSRAEGEKGTGAAARGTLPDGSPGEGASLTGGSIGAGAPYTIEWTQGGTRKLQSGELPAYPPGVAVQAQVKLLTTVRPDGSVSAVQPYQKADRRLEEAAIKQVRLWRFDPLRADQPQVDQTCVITFLFRLR